MATMTIQIPAAPFGAKPRGYTFTGTLQLPQVITDPIRINSAVLTVGYVRLYANRVYMKLWAGDTAMTTALLPPEVADDTMRWRTVNVNSITVGNDHLLKVQGRTVTFEINALSSGSGNIMDKARGENLELTIDYEVTTTACTPLTSLSLDRPLTEGSAVLTGSGAGGGVANGIIGYELQFRDSADGVNYGGWQGYSTAYASSGGFSLSVPPPNRGYSRHWRARTLGSAGEAWYSGFLESSNAVKRYGLSIPTLSKDILDAGETARVTIGAMDSMLTHRVNWIFGERKETNSKVAGVFNDEFAIPLGWIDQIPNAESGRAKCELETMLDGVVLGSLSVDFTIKCPLSVVPGVGSLTAQRLDNGVPAEWNDYVAGVSQCRLTIGDDVAGQGSYIAAYAITGPGINSNARTGDTALLQKGNQTYTATVTDGRGRTASKTAAITVIEYQKPVITDIDTFRCDAQGVQVGGGTYVKCIPSYKYYTVQGKNAVTVSIKYRKKGVTGWTSGFTGALISGGSKVLGNGAIEAASSYETLYTIQDSLGNTAEYMDAVGSAEVLIHKRANNKGIGLGCYCEADNRLQISENWELYVKGKTLLNYFYPIGSIYTSVNATNPGSLFGGTWVAWGAGRVSVGVGSNGTTNYPTAEAIGGIESHGHTVNNHTHTINDHSHYVGGHTHTTGNVWLSIDQMPSHSHAVIVNIQHSDGEVVSNSESLTSNLRVGGRRRYYDATGHQGGGGAHNHGNTGYTDIWSNGCGALTSNGAAPGTNAADNRQPYITCYKWKRTA